MNVYNYKEVKEKFKNQYNIEVQITRKKLFKIAKGLYSDTKNVDELVILFKKYPGCILTLESAFYYYELSEYKPNKITVGTRRNFTRIHMSNVEQFFYSNTRLDDNSIHYIKDGLEVNVFSRERLLVELIRNKKRFNQEYYKEVYDNFLRISDSLDEELVVKYAKMYRNKEAENFAKKYIHYIRNEDDYEYYFGHDKSKAYEYGARTFFHDEECECCKNKTIGIIQKICSKCGWWNSYFKNEDENEVNEDNGMSLQEYRIQYFEKLEKDPNYNWAENRNRTGPIRKIIKKTIIDEEKNVCSCCGRNSINRWYEQCFYCGWIADYVQETEEYDYGDNGPNEYPLWWYREDYEKFIQINPNYIYKDNPKKFIKFLERDIDEYPNL